MSATRRPQFAKDGRQIASSETVFLRLLRDAAAAVADEYIALPRHQPETGAAKSYLERVYCYELYHQMRALMDAAQGDRLARAVAAGWRVNGEVDKRMSYIPGARVPDFIWHRPGRAANGHVLEVKRSRAESAAILEDVDKLQTFRRDADYGAATLLIVGPHDGDPHRWATVLGAAKSADVQVLFHRGAGLAVTRDCRAFETL